MSLDVWDSVDGKKTIGQPLGKCTVFDEDLNVRYNEIPCLDTYLQKEWHKLMGGYGYCLAGTSVTGMPVEKYDPTFYVGTPGSRHLKGSIFSVDADKVYKAVEKHIEFSGNSYIGYSTSAGNVIDENRFGDVMVGAPRYGSIFEIHCRSRF